MLDPACCTCSGCIAMLRGCSRSPGTLSLLWSVRPQLLQPVCGASAASGAPGDKGALPLRLLAPALGAALVLGYLGAGSSSVSRSPSTTGASSSSRQQQQQQQQRQRQRQRQAAGSATWASGPGLACSWAAKLAARAAAGSPYFCMAWACQLPAICYKAPPADSVLQSLKLLLVRAVE